MKQTRKPIEKIWLKRRVVANLALIATRNRPQGSHDTITTSGTTCHARS